MTDDLPTTDDGDGDPDVEVLEDEDIPPAHELDSVLDINYAAVQLPDKPYDEFNYAQRRKALLNRLEHAGHPQALDQTYSELGDEFGRSKSTISKDFKILAEWTARNLDRDHVMILDTVFRKAIMDLVDEGKYAWAAELGKEWFEWLVDMGVMDKVPDRIDLDHTIRQDPKEGDEYRIIPDDEEDAIDVDEVEAETEGDA